MNRRQEIVDILKLRLQNISKANGYENDIVKVDEWVMSKLQDKDMPCLVLRDTGSSVDNSVSGTSSNRLQIEVDVLVSDKETTMRTLRSIMSDVLKAFGNESEDFYEHRTFDGDEVLVEHQDKLYGGTRMKFTVVYDAAQWEM
ncbi:hypothetical protein [Sulfurimonas sp. NWX79]|uniref:hypothetical protein n=1 Tax=Campylobacterales TaxID=213849 RepID=UPI003204A328|nr:hypothetical protein IAPFLPAM_00039 [Sulfurimonas phage SNW-1]